MELSTEILAAVSTLLLIIVIYSKRGSKRNVPPSLPWLPVVGSLPFLSGIDTLHVCLTEKAKRYGNIYTFYAGRRYAVVLNGYDAIREALVKRSKDFAGRERVYAEYHIWNKNSQGLGFRQYSEYFKMLRNSTIFVMKKLGFGERATMEMKIQEEIADCIKYIHEKKGIAFDTEHILRMSVLNIVYNFTFGERFKWNDPIGEYISDGVVIYVRSFLPILDLFPIVRFFSPFKEMLKDITPRSVKWKQFLGDKIKESLANSEHEDTFIKEFIKKTGSDFDLTELYYIVKDFLNGGTDTTTTQLRWALILLCNNPRVQECLRKEMDAVVPKERLPSLIDQLPYLEATILEVMRIKTIIPMGIPHKTTCDTEVAGYFIPADTQVVVNLSSAHMDPSVWEEPELFRPERFLNEKGDIVNRDQMISFSLGKRSCPGEVLARHELFLFLGAIIQQFNILPPDGQTSISESGKVGIVYAPDPFKLRLVPRML